VREPAVRCITGPRCLLFLAGEGLSAPLPQSACGALLAGVIAAKAGAAIAAQN
jgi:hypothetical protein